MDSAGFKTPVEDRYFEDYLPGAVHEFGRITIDEESTVAFAKQFDPQLFHTDWLRPRIAPPPNPIDK